VIDALFELLAEGAVPPSVEDVAARAEVSVSSVFRYFENLDDLHEQTIMRYFERFDHLFEVPAAPGSDRSSRVTALVEARLALYEGIAPLARLARRRAPELPRLQSTLHDTRLRLAAQVRAHLAPDLGAGGDDAVDDRAALVDVLTSFEAWDLLRDTHDRDRASLARTWTRGIEALLRA
jgi:AcrR family transcriptional regulator